ncbi:ATP-binding protein involved in chromosome partitioning-like protein [Leptotrombidium deliense]|uniref:ATP-binding protein involved in chromosome partitioning-like protein n=1 Tax=Leptotrombidium deliense TaxID=299467 RepID=A0A443SJN7_9ACAR|nr:ATP-binding protein involved in chromosome partitioning-like protein [Leptotrombidium deliense]
MSNTRPVSDTSNGAPQPLRGASIDLQERTLKVTNIDSNVSKELLHELFSQAGPVVNVVHKPEFAFVEFEDAESVGYAMALMQGVALNGSELQMQPKLNRPEYYRYLNTLKQYESTIACNPHEWWQRFGSPDRPIPPDLCRGIVCPMPPSPIQQQVHPFRHHFQPHNYMPQPVSVPHHLYQYNMPPPKDSYKQSRYSLPNEHHFNRNYINGNSVNGRYTDRYSPYRRPMDNRHGDRNNLQQQFYERDYRDTDWRHRRSN